MSDFTARIQAILDTKKIPNQLKSLEKDLKFNATIKKFVLDTKGLPSQIQASLDNHKFKISLDGIKTNGIETQMSKAGENIGKGLVQRITNKLQDGSISVQISKLNAQYEKMLNSSSANGKHNELQKIKTDIEELTRLQNAMNASNNNQALVKNYSDYNILLNKTKNSMSVLSAESKTFVSHLQVQNLDNKIATWMQNNTKATQQFGSKVEQLRGQLQELSMSGNPSATQFNSIKKQFEMIKTEAVAAGKIGMSYGDRLKGTFDSLSRYLSVSTLLYKGIQGLREMYQNVYNIDKEMTELKKVTDETADSYAKFLKSTRTDSKELGTTMSDLISSTADFARLGYSFNESQGLAKAANIYAVVGDEISGIDEATKSLISTMAAFKGEMTDTMSQSEFAMSIIDKFNAIGNSQPISSGGIGDALTRSASALAAANNTLDESIALITASNTVVQNPEVVGTALKTMSMRIRGAKTELEEAGLDTDNMAESTAKLREEIKALSGVDVMLNEDTFKSTYQILKELSAEWQNLTDIQKASITELIAGKRGGNVVSSLMSNFDVAEEVVTTSMNSQGSATQEHQKWLESMEAKTNQLKAAWEGLSQAFMNDAGLKKAIDTGTGILSVFTDIVDTFGTIPTLATAVAAALSFKNIGRDKKPSLSIVNADSNNSSCPIG